MSYLFEVIALNNTAVFQLANGSSARATSNCSQIYDVLKHALERMESEGAERSKRQEQPGLSHSSCGPYRRPVQYRNHTRFSGDRQTYQEAVAKGQIQTDDRMDFDDDGKGNNPLSDVTTTSAISDGAATNNDVELPIKYDWIDFSPVAKDEETKAAEGRQSTRNTATSNSPNRHPMSHLKPSTNDICSPFLCHLIVKINIMSIKDAVLAATSSNDDIKLNSYDSQVLWAIRYNLAVLIHYAATNLGERGNLLLKQAHVYYTTAQLTIPPKVPYQDCFRLLLSTQNNLSCIYLDFGMYEEHMSSIDLLSHLISDLQSRGSSLMGGDQADGGTLTNPQEDAMNHKIFLNLMVLSRYHLLAGAA